MRFDFYQHDSPEAFWLALMGEFRGAEATQVTLALQAAVPTLEGRPLLVEVSEVSGIDPAALDFLRRTQQSGVRIVSRRPPKCAELLAIVDSDAPLLGTRRRNTWYSRWLRARLL